jgi:hypothetical protein
MALKCSLNDLAHGSRGVQGERFNPGHITEMVGFGRGEALGFKPCHYPHFLISRGDKVNSPAQVMQFELSLPKGLPPWISVTLTTNESA